MKGEEGFREEFFSSHRYPDEGTVVVVVVVVDRDE